MQSKARFHLEISVRRKARMGLAMRRMAWRGHALQGEVSFVRFVTRPRFAGLGSAWRCEALHSKARIRLVIFYSAGQCDAWHGKAQQSTPRRGFFCYFSPPGYAFQGSAKYGTAMPGSARCGSEHQGKDSFVDFQSTRALHGLVVVRQGTARRCIAVHCEARRG